MNFRDKPEVKTVKSLDFMQVLDYLESLPGQEGIKNRLWEEYILSQDISNNSSFWMEFPPEEQREHYKPDILVDLDLIQAIWNLEDELGITMFVCW